MPILSFTAFLYVRFFSCKLDSRKLMAVSLLQVIKAFSIREGWWYIGIKGDGDVKSKGTRLLIEKEK